jgi:hypothetical protein
MDKVQKPSISEREIDVFCKVTPYNMEDIYRRFGGTFRLHHQHGRASLFNVKAGNIYSNNGASKGQGIYPAFAWWHYGSPCKISFLSQIRNLNLPNTKQNHSIMTEGKVPFDFIAHLLLIRPLESE